MENMKKARMVKGNRFITSATDLCDMIIEHSNDLYIGFNQEFRIIHFNKKAEELFGISKEEALNKSLFTYFPEADDQSFMEKLIDVLQGKKAIERILLRSHRATYACQFLPLTDKYNKIAGALGILRDNSERIEAEEKIQVLTRSLSEKEFLLNNRAKMAETILDASNELIMVLDKQLIFRAANRGFSGYCNKSQAELIGSRLEECFPRVKDSVFLQKVKEGFTGHSASLSNMPCIFKPGFCDVFITPLSYADHVYGVLVIAQDRSEKNEYATEMNRMIGQLDSKNNEIAEKNRLVETLFNSSKNFIILTDKELNILDVNASLLSYLGAKKEEVTTRTLYDLYPDIRQYEIYEKIRMAMEGEAQLFYHYKFQRMEAYADISIIPLKNEQGLVIKLLIITQ